MAEKKMNRNIFFFSWMWIVLLFSIVLLIPHVLLKLMGFHKRDSEYIHKVTSIWAGHLIFTSGSRIIVKGIDNVPSGESFCVVANHQSNFDIPILLSILPVELGFIAKSEMERVPFLSTWMKGMNCVFIKRKKLKHSMHGFNRAMENVKSGQSMVLFPQGTRSRHGITGKFHRAGVGVAIKENVLILPVTIKNSHLMFENWSRITPTEVEVVIHKARSYGADQIKSGTEELIGIIKEELEKGEKND